jgi:hypothetical protein
MGINSADVNIGDIIQTHDRQGIVTEVRGDTILFNDLNHDYVCDINDIVLRLEDE